MKDVAIITVTRERPTLLRRAMLSVQLQDCYARIRHYIIIDDCPATRDFLSRESFASSCEMHYCKRAPHEQTGPSRCALCLNCGVSIATEKWVAFLDDDNEYEPNHISSLLKCAESHRTRAVHSYTRMFHPDGSPFTEERNPWCLDPEEARKEYQLMLSRGVRTKGSNVIKDSMDTKDHSPIDIGEWLLRRDILLEIPFVTEFAADDLQIGRHEDDIFLEELSSRGEPIACSQLPTLRYYLGGYSTKDGGYANPYAEVPRHE
jgi:hypothetical protein